MNVELAKFIPWLPALSALLCGACACNRKLRVLAAPICIASIAAAFGLSFAVSRQIGHEQAATVHFFDWIHVGGIRGFNVDFSYFIDPLTILMLFVVTGIGSLVAWYAAWYMKGDRGYARFFAFVSLFIFAMTTLVMADNLVLLYLGWEGVGACSYLLIGYYYDHPSAVAAAKKAFIVNRIGDLGFALGIWLIYSRYQTVSLQDVTRMAGEGSVSTSDLWIPFLLMLGAFGKSAQIPLYVWLPDAMEGPTPVSALIHAATMVTAGVYMIARLLPVFELSPYALPTVATVGALTAVFAASIALCQYDIKRIYAYSTISQLGYMFLGVGVMSSVGGVFHLFTHAFFKALLFLTAGSVMHSLAGQLDLRKMSGMRQVMPVTAGLMLVGCLALAGFPFMAGFFSKDMILAAAMERGIGPHGHSLYLMLACVGLFTALLTAYYTFRLWFRVFMGPLSYEMGHEHHRKHPALVDGKPAVLFDDDEAEKEDEEEHAGHAHHHEPHEMPFLMNLPLFVLAIGAIAAGFMCEHWVHEMVQGSTAKMHEAIEGHGPRIFGIGLHVFMMGLSSVIALVGIGIAAYFHWFNRAAADRAAQANAGLVKLLENKWYVDEIYDAMIVQPLHLTAEIAFAFDRLVIDGVVSLIGFLPRLLGYSIRPAARGSLQGYGLGMAAGAALLIAVVVWML